MPFSRTGDLYVLESGSDSILRISPDGAVSVAVTTAEIQAASAGRLDTLTFSDRGIAFDDAGNMYFAVSEQIVVGGFAWDAVMKRSGGSLSVLASDGAISAITGLGNAAPGGLAFGSDGMLYTPDDITGAGSILQIHPATGAVSVYVSHAALEAVLGPLLDVEIGIAGAPGGVLYGTSDGQPNAIFRVAADQTVQVLASGSPFADLDVFMTRAANGDLVVGDNSTADTIRRITPGGVVSDLLSTADITSVTGGTVDLEGGLAFDSDGSFYVAEASTDSILKYVPDGLGGWTGSVWVSAADMQAVTGVAPIINGGIAFAPVPVPPAALLGGAGLLAAGVCRWLRRRRQP